MKFAVDEGSDTFSGQSTISDTQVYIASLLEPLISEKGILNAVLKKSLHMNHIISLSPSQAIENLISLLKVSIKSCLDYNATHPEFPLEYEQIESYINRSFYTYLAWSFGSGLGAADRAILGDLILAHTKLFVEKTNLSPFEYDVDLFTGNIIPWETTIQKIEIESQSVTSADVIIPTPDTAKHEKLIYSWLSQHRSVILCGPPGSGKSMTLLAALRRIPDSDVIPLNFSSETSPEMVLKTLELNCNYKQSSSGLTLSPKAHGSWLVLFCDEINLPRPDKYGAQRVICFLRQLIEHQGFWSRDCVWVHLRNIQLVGACNPPTDPGRHPLTTRFTRHCPILYVDYPGQDSLSTIYSSFCRAALRQSPNLRGYFDCLSYSMITLYSKTKARFTVDQQAHYIYSPRELTRWIRGMYGVLKNMEFVSVEDLVRIWAHEAYRLFYDRLVSDEERDWMESCIEQSALESFPNVDIQTCLKPPILFSNLLSRKYEYVDKDELESFIESRLQTYYEEECDAALILHDKALEHILRIDRVLQQPQGHMLLIGLAGSGKTSLTKFVCWMNGVTIFQPAVHKRYTLVDFDNDLRAILKRCCKGEKICLLLNEGCIMDTSFLERMNTLLANSEIPGLFEGDEYLSLMSSCKEVSLRAGLNLESHDELYKWFSHQVMKNLHVVFTMNPPEEGFASKTTASPALFNRCVLNWMGDWDLQAFYKVADGYLSHQDLHRNYTQPTGFQPFYSGFSKLTFEDAVIDSCLFFHSSALQMNDSLCKRGLKGTYLSPGHFLEFLQIFNALYENKKTGLEDRQRHLIVGLEKLQETLVQVNSLREGLAKKRETLERKTQEANEKLKRMVHEQKEAESKRLASIEIQEALVSQNAMISERRQIVMADLAKAEPAVLEAQESVSSIKKQHLTEMRSMANPPNPVKITMEAVCTLLGNKVESWKSVQAVLRRDDFISSIVNYTTDKLTTEIKREIQNNYLSDANFNFEVVNRASKACGPLLQWVVAQIAYADILEKVIGINLGWSSS